MKIKADSLTMMSDIVKTAIRNKEVTLYAQSPEFAKQNLGTAFISVIGETVFFLSQNGTTIFTAKEEECGHATLYCKENVVELE